MQLTTVQEVQSSFPELEIIPVAEDHPNKTYKFCFDYRGTGHYFPLPVYKSEIQERLDRDKPQHERAADLTRKLYESSIKLIDEKNGPGYARKNPNLLGNVLNTHRSMYLTLEENAKK